VIIRQDGRQTSADIIKENIPLLSNNLTRLHCFTQYPQSHDIIHNIQLYK
jgi:hypothetical protein